MDDPFATLAARPRVKLASLPTPLHRADRLGRELGAEIWIKRDDIGSLGLAGNEVRKKFAAPLLEDARPGRFRSEPATRA